MIAQDILAKIRHIEIHTRRLLSSMQVGDYSTAQKGSGLEFDQIREYQAGDDVRFIDWSGTARTNKMLVRQYLEERNRTIVLAVDSSLSTKFGSTGVLKSERMAELASVLALVADYGKDAVGLICYTEKVEQYLPPARGRKHVHALMKHLLENATDGVAQKKMSLPIHYRLEQLVATKHKNTIVILISDFIERDSSIEVVGRAGTRADVMAIRCLDPVERTFPNVGILAMSDSENQAPHFFDMSKNNIAYYNRLLHERLDNQNKMLRKYNIDCLDVSPAVPYMRDLINFFRRRMMY